MDPKFDKLHGVTTKGFSIGSKRLADSSAILDLVSTTKGFLPPRMTETQRINIVTPAAGLVVFDTTHQCLYSFQDDKWVALTRHAYLEADTSSILTGYFGYMDTDGVLALTDAAEERKSLFVGGFTGLPGVVLMNGYMLAKFSTTSPIPVAGDRVYLARADLEPAGGAAGKLTTAVSSGYVSEVGIVYGVDGPSFVLDQFAGVVVYPSRISTLYQQEVEGAILLGSINGVNTIFTVPSKFLHSSKRSIRVYYNGKRLFSGVGNDYVVSESGGPGTGYDTVILSFAPKGAPGIDRLTADYTEL